MVGATICAVKPNVKQYQAYREKFGIISMYNITAEFCILLHQIIESNWFNDFIIYLQHFPNGEPEYRNAQTFFVRVVDGTY